MVGNEGSELRRVVQDCVREELKSGDRLVAIGEAARLLDLSVPALRKAYQRGTVPTIRIGRRIRFRLRDLLGTSA